MNLKPPNSLSILIYSNPSTVFQIIPAPLKIRKKTNHLPLLRPKMSINRPITIQSSHIPRTPKPYNRAPISSSPMPTADIRRLNLRPLHSNQTC